MKNDISKEIDLNAILEGPQESVPQQVQEASAEVLADFAEIVEEWSYRLPKGYPTMVDGKFTEYEEVKILNEILEDRGFNSVRLPEAKPTAKKSKAVLQPKAFASWWSELPATSRTKFFELIPIVQALQPNKPVTVSSILQVVQSTPNLDWGDIDFILKPLSKFLKSKDTLAYLDSHYFAGNSPDSPIPAKGGMVAIFNNKAISSFIWSSIESFYGLVDKSASEKGSKNKVFTADVILFWGVKDPKSEDIQNKVKIAIDNPKLVNQSVVEIGANQYMACVSLKAGHGRIGKLTQYMGKFVDIAPDETDDSMSESLLGDIGDKLKSMAKSAGSKVVELFNKVKQFFTDLTAKVVEAKNNAVESANVISGDLSELLEIIQEEDPEFNLDQTIQEGDDGYIVCNTCMQKKIQDMDKFLTKFLAGTALDDFEKKVQQLASQPGFIYRLEKLDSKKADIKKAILSTKKVIDSIKKAKAPKQTSSSKRGKCAILDLRLTRSDMKNIFFISANQNAIMAITGMLDNAFPKGVQGSSKAMDALLKLSVDLNAQSIFGKSGNLPLVKFTGTATPQQLGTKQDYVKGALATSKQYAKYLGAQKLPVVGLKVTPSAGSKGTQDPYYYRVVLYTLFAIEASDEIGPSSFQYAEIAFKANSGSKFTFAVEGDSVAPGTKLIKLFAK